MRSVYLFWTIVGTLVPLGLFAAFFVQQGQSVGDFVLATFANYAASGFVLDLFISSAVFWVYMFRRRNRGPNPWPFVALNLCIGLSCALPAYLYVNAGRAAQPTA